MVSKPKEVKPVEYPEPCGDDWCLNGPPHCLANTYFLCRACSVKAQRKSINTTEWSVMLKCENKRVGQDRPAVLSNDGNLNFGESFGVRPKLTLWMMEDFVEEHCDNLESLDWRLRAKFYQWRECLNNPTPDTKCVYSTGRREWLRGRAEYMERIHKAPEL